MLKTPLNQVKLIYVYRDACSACQSRKPKFEFEVKSLLNFIPNLKVVYYPYETTKNIDELNKFLAARSNIEVTHVPMLIGISKKGNIFETDESNSKEQIAVFLNQLYRN
jgi:hypothetical protein